MKRAILCLAAAVLIAVPQFLSGQARGASERPRVLVIAAHPDDEDTQLIAWLQKGGRAETAYLSLTRGDGGQNFIGNELGEALGVIRTEELLAARRIDGAHQFFTRAYDFGFSKNADEAFRHWPKDSLLNDVVTVVRSWRPDVIVAIFSGTPRDGHGQHQVSGILAKEAYESAMDTVRFPVSQFGPAWTPLKFYRFSRFSISEPTLRFNVGEYNSTLGRSYAEIAGESRSQHKSQGFGAIQRKGVVWDMVRREASRVNESIPATSEKSILDGLPVRSAASSRRLIESGNDIAIEAIADREYLAVGDSARAKVTLYNRSRAPLNVQPQSSAHVRVETPMPPRGAIIAPDSEYTWTVVIRGTEVSQPWWLASRRNGDLFSPTVPVLHDASDWMSTPEDERDKSGWLSALVTRSGGVAVSEVRAPVVFRFVDPIRGDLNRPLVVAPPVSITLDRVDELARANAKLDRFVNVTLRSASVKPQNVTVTIVLPAGMTADSTTRTITLDSAATKTLTFRVRGRLTPGDHTLTARASSGGQNYRSGYVPIDYEHITPQRIYRPAELTLHAIAIDVPDRLDVAYVRGVGDNVVPALEELGIPVTEIEPRRIPTVNLSKFTTVVVGPRAYQASRDLIDNNSFLLDYAKDGGTLVVQYGQYEMTRPGMMPYPITIARPHDRVTEEVSPVTLTDPASPALRHPNKIEPGDFSGWVQERALYMPRTSDANYRSMLSLNDPGEPANRGGILIAPYGKGVYVYTSLAFFRQLPAGVSGASKLFVNLLSLTSRDVGVRATTGR